MFKKQPVRPATKAGTSSSSRSTRVESLVEESRNWEQQRTAELERSEARAWATTRILSAISLLSVAALIVMLPFYKVIPIIFEIDRVSGEVMQAITDPSSVKPTEVMTKNQLAAYVSRRERYHWTLLDDDYEAVLALSDEVVAKDYKAIYDGPNALDKRLGDGTDIRVKIMSVELSPNDPKRGTVRWERKTRRNNQEVGGAERFVSSVSFKFSPPNVFVREKTLIANPMGFKVDGYAVASILVNEAKK